MKSGMADDDSFAILTDEGQMIAGASVHKRKMVVVSPVSAYRGFDTLPVLTPEVEAFAEAEASRLGMIDEP